MKYEYYASNIPTHWEEVAVHKLPFLCLVSVSDPGSRVLGIGKANKVRDSAQQLLPC